jgi:hypothetical protein
MPASPLPSPAYHDRPQPRPRDIFSGVALCLCLVLALALTDLVRAAPAEATVEGMTLRHLAAGGYTIVLKDRIADCAQGL